MTSPSRDVAREPTKEASVPVPLLAVVLLLFASSALRFRGMFLDPMFWAEDGTFFFREAWKWGLPRSSFRSTARITDASAGRFRGLVPPDVLGALLYAVAAGLLSSFGLDLFSRAGYRWLVPDDRLRVLVCWLFSLAPGTYETYFALSPGELRCSAGSLLAARARRAGPVADGYPASASGVVPVVLPGQGLVLAAPLIAYLFWLTRNRNYLLLPRHARRSRSAESRRMENEYRPGFSARPRPAGNHLLREPGGSPGLPLLVPYGFTRPCARWERPFLVGVAGLDRGLSVGGLQGTRRDAEGVACPRLAVLCAMAISRSLRWRGTTALSAFTRAQMTLGGRHGLVPAVLALLLLWQWLARPGGTALVGSRQPYSWPGRRSASFTNPTTSRRTRRCAARGVAGPGRDDRRGLPCAASRHPPGSCRDSQDPLPSGLVPTGGSRG